VKKLRILLTGGSGLLGRRFIEDHYQNYEISVISRNQNYRTIRNEDFILCDLSKPWDLKVLPKNIDVLVLLAQDRNYKDFPENSSNIFMVNVYATQRLMEYARQSGIRKVIYASSGGIYREQMEALRENSLLRQTFDSNFYCSTKLAAEGLVASYRDVIDATIIRPFFIYGKHQNLSSLILNLRNRVLNNEAIILNGDSGILLNPIYVKDAADALNILICRSNDFVLNIAGPEIVSMRQLSTIISEALGKVPKFKIEAKKFNIIGDSARLHDIMTNQIWTPLRVGIDECLR